MGFYRCLVCPKCHLKAEERFILSPQLNFQSIRMKCLSSLLSIFVLISLHGKVSAKDIDNILNLSKVLLHNIVQLNSSCLALRLKGLHQCAIISQELSSLNIYFLSTAWLSDQHYFFSLTGSFLNKLSIGQLNIMQVQQFAQLIT